MGLCLLALPYCEVCVRNEALGLAQVRGSRLLEEKSRFVTPLVLQTTPCPPSRCADSGPDGSRSVRSSLSVQVPRETAPGAFGEHIWNHPMELTLVFLEGGRIFEGSG